MAPIIIPAAERFWPKVNKTDTCWLWIANTNKKGYGRFVADNLGHLVAAHRWSWEQARGPIPDGLCVLHRCDVPACVNPAHLFLGTHADNTADMLAKCRGRNGGRRGEQIGNAKLTRLQVDDIRSRLETGQYSHRGIAALFRVGKSTIGRISRREQWL